MHELNELVEDLTRGERRQDYPDEREPRYQALQTFRETGDAASPAIPALTKLLHDERFAMEAASALVSIGAKSVDPLIKALDDKNEEVRSRSAYALGELRAEAKAAVPALKLASNTNETISVRTPAIRSLGRIGYEPARVVPLLNALLKHPDNMLRSSATHAIGAFGNDARESIQALRLLLNDEDRLVRDWARQSSDLIENADHSLVEPADFDKLTITGWPYQTKPIWLTYTGGMFYWFITEDQKMVGYEPCCGIYEIDLLKEAKEELVFKVIESRGQALDLNNGQRIAKSEVVGKEFRAKIKGDQIVAITVSSQ